VNSLVFAEYLNRVLWNATRGDDAPSEVIPQWVLNATAVTVVILVVVLVAGTRTLGPRAAVVLTSMKVCNSRIALRSLLTKLIESRFFQT
jgi:ABC-type iron transport system FetAB permease component